MCMHPRGELIAMYICANKSTWHYYLIEMATILLQRYACNARATYEAQTRQLRCYASDQRDAITYLRKNSQQAKILYLL